MRPQSRMGLLFLNASLFLAILTGCSNTDPATIQLNKAEAALDAALAAWMRGEPADKFADVDPDWKAGYRLQSFLTADTKIVDGQSDQVRCRVALSLKNAKGKQVDKEVAYVVQMGSAITIRREDKK